MNIKIIIALYEPEIPQNVGTILRTCACFDLHLVLIEPIGFVLEDRNFKRAKLDYNSSIELIPSYEDFFKKYGNHRIILLSPHTSLSISSVQFKENDVILFGRESNGIEDFIAKKCNIIASIPMNPETRSFNLAMSMAMISFQAICQ